MRAFVLAAGVRVVNEAGVKMPVQLFIDQMVEKAIPHARLVNVPRLRIRYVECRILPVNIRFSNERSVQFGDIVGQITLKFDHVFLMPFAAQKPLPSKQEIFNTYAIFVRMNKHNSVTPPPLSQAPLVLVRAKESYRIWHDHLANVKRVDRLTIGTKIDETYLSLLEHIFRATFAYDKFEKLSVVSQAVAKCDLLKFFLQMGWEQKILNNTLYGSLIVHLDEVGRMLGGWRKSLQEKTPTK